MKGVNRAFWEVAKQGGAAVLFVLELIAAIILFISEVL